MVNEQGEVVDSIANHIEIADDYIEKGNEHLKKTNKSASTNRKLKIAIGLALIVVVGIIALVALA